MILECILPFYVASLKKKTESSSDIANAAKTEINSLVSLSVSIRALISGTEALTRFNFKYIYYTYHYISLNLTLY